MITPVLKGLRYGLSVSRVNSQSMYLCWGETKNNGPFLLQFASLAADHNDRNG